MNSMANRHFKSLQKYNQSSGTVAAEDFFEDEEVALRPQHSSYDFIPRFYRATDTGSARAKWKAEAKKELLQQKSNKMWDSGLMHLLWRLLLEHAHCESGQDKETGIMDFLVYDEVRQKLIKIWNENKQKNIDSNFVGIHPFLTATSFLRLPKDDNGRLPILTFFNYMLKKVTLYQTRIELGVNDNGGDGWLTESEMENYFYDLIPTVPALTRLPEHFYPFYVCGAVRKFFFFLDPHKRGKISIDGIMQSPVLADLMELQNASETEECIGNWFAMATAAKIYSHYVQLDVDRNGMLNKHELYNYNESSFTCLFIDRVFEVCQTYAGEMDYKKFIEFVLAVENPASNQAFEFFWKILDLQNKGYLTPFVIKLFCREVSSKLIENGLEPVSLEDVVVEIFDMVRTDEPLTIRKADLQRCKNRDTIINILIDYKAFWRYDNRELLATQQAQQAAQLQQQQQQQQQSPTNSSQHEEYNYSQIASDIEDALA